MDEEVFTLSMSRSELNAIIKAMKHRKLAFEKLLAKKPVGNPHIEGIKKSIQLNEELTEQLLWLKSHSRINYENRYAKQGPLGHGTPDGIQGPLGHGTPDGIQGPLSTERR